MRRAIFPILIITFAVCFLAVAGKAAPLPQQNESQSAPPPGERPQFNRRGDMAFGTVTSVGVDRFDVKTRDGLTRVIVVNDQTKYREDQKPIALEDLKVGDRVAVHGTPGSDKSFTATMVRRMTEQDMARFQGSRAFGRITAINGNEITVENRREGQRVIVVNDQTSFVKEGQTIALKDLKVGDRVAAMGREENGKFIAERVMTGQFMRHRGRMGGEGRMPPPDNP
jgi:Domain of unknown function (DUF5666)